MLNEIDYLVFDENAQYNYRADKEKIARTMGYQYISQAMVELYRKHQSTIKVAEIFEVTEKAINYHLRKIGEPLRPPGKAKWKP